MSLEDLIGTWKLMSHQFVASETGESGDMFGTDPQGYMIISPDARMMAIITSTERSASDGEAGLYKSMLAYGGPVRVEGADQFITRVEVSWHPGWVGTEQARTISLAGGILTMMTSLTSHPMFPGQTACSVLKWQRTMPV